MRWDTFMKKLLFGVLLSFGSVTLYGNTEKTDTIKTDIFEIVYSETLEQPLWIRYKVMCPMGTEQRRGLDFYTNDSIHTSDVEDYKGNVYDRGHLAPAAAFSCNRDTLKQTFTYLNCALQHEGLNRGPWKDLEEIERGLPLFVGEVWVEIYVRFDETPEKVSGGASIPKVFDKFIYFNDTVVKFSFPNVDVAGEPWENFRVIE